MIREATSLDAAAIARLHVTVWREAYRLLAPAEAQAALDEAARLARWSALLAEPEPGWTILLAEVDGGLAGFGTCGPSPDLPADDRGFVQHLYVSAVHRRRGIGRALLEALASRLAEQGHRGIGLGVVLGNEPALAFYRSLGGRIIGRYTDPGPLWRSTNLLLAWDEPVTFGPRPEV